MTILIYERDLFWTARVAQNARGLGHNAIPQRGYQAEPGDVAIVNLSDPKDVLEPLIQALQAQGTYVIGHAGHKEKPKLAVGHTMGCDKVSTNRELTEHLARLLAAAPQSEG